MMERTSTSAGPMTVPQTMTLSPTPPSRLRSSTRKAETVRVFARARAQCTDGRAGRAGPSFGALYWMVLERQGLKVTRGDLRYSRVGTRGLPPVHRLGPRLHTTHGVLQARGTARGAASLPIKGHRRNQSLEECCPCKLALHPPSEASFCALCTASHAAMYPVLITPHHPRDTVAAAESLRAAPHSTEDDAEGEEEDYETAMKKLSEKAGDL